MPEAMSPQTQGVASGNAQAARRESQTLTRTSADGVVWLRLPRTRSESHCESISAELREVYEESPLEADWVIDMSEVVHPPLALMTTLYHLIERLHAEGRDVSVVGLNPACILPRELAS